MSIPKYALVNKNISHRAIYVNTDFELVVHEMISIIDSHMTFLQDNNIQLRQNINFDNLFIVEFLEINNKSYDVIHGNYVFNMIKFTICSANAESVLLSKIITSHISTIKLKYDQIVNKTPLITSKPNFIVEKINKHIPNVTIVNKIKSNNEISNIDNIDDIESNTMEELELQIKLLSELQKNESDNLEKIKNQLKEEADYICNKQTELSLQKRDINRIKEVDEAKQKKFYADRTTYYKLKTAIQTNKLTEDKISDLFINQYPIFKFMDGKQILDDDTKNYDVYSQLVDSLLPKSTTKTNKQYVPHNVNYLNDKEKEKYDSVQINDNLIEDFINGHKQLIDKSNTAPLDDNNDSDDDDDDDDILSEEIEEIEEIEDIPITQFNYSSKIENIFKNSI